MRVRQGLVKWWNATVIAFFLGKAIGVDQTGALVHGGVRVPRRPGVLPEQVGAALFFHGKQLPEHAAAPGGFYDSRVIERRAARDAGVLDALAAKGPGQ